MASRTDTAGSGEMISEPFRKRGKTPNKERRQIKKTRGTGLKALKQMPYKRSVREKNTAAHCKSSALPRKHLAFQVGLYCNRVYSAGGMFRQEMLPIMHYCVIIKAPEMPLICYFEPTITLNGILISRAQMSGLPCESTGRGRLMFTLRTPTWHVC